MFAEITKTKKGLQQKVVSSRNREGNARNSLSIAAS
jgi:hypothetical protein